MASDLETTAAKLAGVVGCPVSHSLSPLIHTIWAQRAGVNGWYVPIEVPAAYDDFARAMDSLRIVGFAGVNVTLPHKEHALRYADAASDVATKAGAANMLTFGKERAEADNSDVEGFAASVRAAIGDDQPERAVVFGAGGAARGVVLALQAVGVKSIVIINRTAEKAEKIAADLGGETVAWDARSKSLQNTDILVNTTSLGMSGQPALEADLSGLPDDAIVADIVYAPLETDLLKRARAKGCAVIDGLAMLMHQALPGFRAWFGADAAVDDALRAELVRELERRARS